MSSAAVAEMLKWIAELFVLQICMFPDINDETKVGLTDTDAASYSQSKYSCAILFSMCQEYVVGQCPWRDMCNFYVDLAVHKGGRLVEIEFTLQDNDVCKCPNHWCQTYQSRHAIPDFDPDDPMKFLGP